MGCLFAIVAGFFPRVALVVVWLTTNLVDRAFGPWILPLLGLFFLPFTTLVYVLAYSPVIQLGNGRWLWVALAFLVELAGYAGTGRTNRRG
ncbi:hypothetical protein DSM104299_05249 [Baekduia alba]|uniref:hypothetical protein n=1 Tax=Baekduia alba TaxID=2997333 RepID=UPI00234141D6|nr:hypothetical protein [Baekduia alba]WCB96490.1 hypothetical protein DSM104299_05249 [Baekduia alba]